MSDALSKINYAAVTSAYAQLMYGNQSYSADQWAPIEAAEKILREQYSHLLADACGVGPGWWPILETLFKNISNLLNNELSNYEVKFVQIKEKFGGLRAYYDLSVKGNDPTVEKWDTEAWEASGNKSPGTEAYTLINSIVTEAEIKAAKTCEICGADGEPRHDGWIKTLCATHHAMKKQVQGD